MRNAESGGWRESELLAQQMLAESTVSTDHSYAIAASHLSVAETHLRNGVELASINDQRQLGATLMTRLATVLRLRGDSKQTAELLQQALVLQRRLSDQIGEANTLQEFGRLVYSLGNLRAAEDYTRQAFNLRRALDHYTAEADSA